jgi:hypothetical protein
MSPERDKALASIRALSAEMIRAGKNLRRLTSSDLDDAARFAAVVEGLDGARQAIEQLVQQVTPLLPD